MRFAKIHGAGNDYIYVDAWSESLDGVNLSGLAQMVSDRHFGIGADGLIAILPSQVADFRMRMFNADGSEGRMCGNGMRGLAKYVYDHGLTQKTEFTVETLAGLIHNSLIFRDGRVWGARVELGQPVFDPAAIPARLELFKNLAPVGDIQARGDLEVAGRSFRVDALVMGTPHAVIFVPSVGGLDLGLFGPVLENHPAFPDRANIDFVEVLSPKRLRMRTWERGSGITLACGTGACASAVAAATEGLVDRHVEVIADGGTLEVDWMPDGRVFLTGPSVEVFTGDFQPR